jgi:hypothetical protein
MMTAYFDESYSRGFTVICGWIASVEEWERFEIDWKLFLISYKVPHFHMKEFAHSVGPFKKWKETRYFRARFIHDAWEVIRPLVRGGFASCVQDVLLERVNRSYKLKDAFSSGYALVGRACVDWAEYFARDSKADVRCIFDDGGPDKRGLIRAAEIEPKAASPCFQPSRDIQDPQKGERRGAVQIQAADFLAYEVSKYIKDHALIRSGSRKGRESLRLFGQKRPEMLFFDEQRLTALCTHFRISPRAPYA